MSKPKSVPGSDPKKKLDSFLARQSGNRLTRPPRLTNMRKRLQLPRNGLRQLLRPRHRFRSQRAPFRRNFLDCSLSRPRQPLLSSRRWHSRSSAAPPRRRQCRSPREARKRCYSRRPRNRFPHEHRASPREGPPRSKTAPPRNHQIHLRQAASPPPDRGITVCLSPGRNHSQFWRNANFTRPWRRSHPDAPCTPGTPPSPPPLSLAPPPTPAIRTPPTLPARQ